MAIKAVIFDFDGVIADTDSMWHGSIAEFMGKRNIELTEEDYENIVGKTFSNKFQILKEKYGLDGDYDEFHNNTHIAATKKIAGELPLNPGVKELINSLEEMGIILAIASANSKKNIHLITDKFNLTDKFSVMVDIHDVTEHKPSPAVYLKTAEKLGIAPNECVAVEDTQLGVESAKNAEMKAIAVPGKFSKGQDFSRADLMVESLEEIDVEKIISLGE
ncbi:MAG: HAD family phosphatase [Candidatus Diapherotrites archaeon]